MNRIERIKRKANSTMYNHLWLRYFSDYSVALIVSVFSAFIFAFGMNVFLNPTGGSQSYVELISGGSSGAAQVFALIFKICGVEIKNSPSLIFSLCYIGINIPLLILAFKGIGKRFGAFTLINVGCVFLFTNILHGQIIDDIALFVHQNGGMVARALFAGICTGLSSAVAFKIDASAGGLDILTYYYSLKKSTTVGKYGAIINGIVIGCFCVLNVVDTHNWAQGISLILFSIIYLLAVMLVVDVINIRNKKAQVQIMTTKKDLPKLLLANVPHGATVVNGKGAYSGADRYIVYMVISSTEIKHVVKVVQQLDPFSFINVTALHQVYGHFFIKPIK